MDYQNHFDAGAGLSNYIPHFYVDVIIYPCPRLNPGLANFCQ